jgi:dCTP deaminase
LNPCSYDYRLGATIKRLTSSTVDLLKDDEYEELMIPEEGLVLHPDECYLGHTWEVVGSSTFGGVITGRSSIGRKFVTNHCTSNLVHAGFFGQLTLEITVRRPTKVYAGIRFGQVSWFSLVGPLDLQYEGAYLTQEGPTPARRSESSLMGTVEPPAPRAEGWAWNRADLADKQSIVSARKFR